MRSVKRSLAGACLQLLIDTFPSSISLQAVRRFRIGVLCDKARSVSQAEISRDVVSLRSGGKADAASTRVVEEEENGASCTPGGGARFMYL